MSSPDRIVWISWLTVFVGVITLGMIIPILAVLFLTTDTIFAASVPADARKLFLGVLIAAYPIAQFFAAPILGQLSDRYGRKPILIISLYGTFASYVVSAIAIMRGDLALLIAGRILDGLTGGNVSIVNSAIADVTRGVSRTKAFSLIGMAFGFGFVIGPFLGGFLSDPSILPWFAFQTPFWFATILAGINLVIAHVLLEETLPEDHRSNARITPWSSIDNIRFAFRSRARSALLVFFLAVFGFAFFIQFFQVYLVEQFSFDQGQIGTFFAIAGISLAVSQGLIVRRFASFAQPRRVVAVALPGLALALFALMIPDHPWQLYLIVPFIALAQAFAQPNLTTIISDHAAPKNRGRMLGVQQSMRSLGIATPPLIAGAAAAIEPMLPTILAGAFVLVAWWYYMGSVHHEQSELPT